MILTKNVILEEIKNGNIKIDSFDEKNLGPASYDLSLGEELRIFVPQGRPYPVTDNANFADITKLIRMNYEGYTMVPGESVLGITAEKVSLASHISGWPVRH